MHQEQKLFDADRQWAWTYGFGIPEIVLLSACGVHPLVLDGRRVKDMVFESIGKLRGLRVRENGVHSLLPFVERHSLTE